MSSLRPKKLSYNVSFTPAEKMRLRGFIAQELGYFNALIEGFAAPMRSMPDAIIAMTGATETLFGEVAALGIDVSRLKPDTLPERLKNFSGSIFDAQGRVTFDAKTLLMFSIANQGGQIDPRVRRAMAVQVLRVAREQASALKQTLAGGESRFAVQALSPLDPRAKRHLQLPQDALGLADAPSDHMMEVTLPYISRAVELPRPKSTWNQLVLRDGGEGDWIAEMSWSSDRYDINRTDAYTTLRAKGNNRKFGK